MPSKRSARNELCILGIDVGGTNIRAGLFSPHAGSIRCIRAVRTEPSRGARHSLDRVATLAREVVAEGEAQGLRADRVGIGIPELVGMSGQIESRCSLNWRADSVRARLRNHGRVTIASDVRAAALAEARLGAGREQPAFLYVSVGTGISCTLVIDGKPYAGAHGHAISFASGPTFVTGGIDGTATAESLEGRASGPGLVRRAQLLGLQEPDAVAVCRAALAAPGVARDVVDAAATELAIHVAIVANALDPTLIVLGGGLGCAPGRYWTTFRAAIPRFAWGPYSRRLRVCRARLGTKAGMIGAALSALEADNEPRRRRYGNGELSV
jgi:Transcriptional regulator/sugar kinase